MFWCEPVDGCLFCNLDKNSVLYENELAAAMQGELEKISSDDKPEQKQLKAYVNKEMGNLDGFILLHASTRYEIDFPKGW